MMGKAARKTAALKALARTWTAFEPVVITDLMRIDFPHLMYCSSIFANSRIEAQIFQVSTSIGGVNQVNLVRHGQIEDVDWEEAQRTIHQLFGPEVSAIEIYPPIEHEWVTKLRMRVVWVLPHTWELPFGLHIAGAWGKPIQ